MVRKSMFLLLLILTVYAHAACNQINAENTVEPVHVETGTPKDTTDILDTEIMEYESNGIQKEVTYDTEYLTHVTIDEGYSITKCEKYSGAEYQYIVYEMENFDGNTKYSRDIYWVIIVLKDKEVFTVLRQKLEEYASAIPTASDLVLETDVNFDGKNDILLWLGHFGTQGSIHYACYLNKDTEFVECPSFSEIGNPAVDTENRVILSSWRNWAASHSYAMYYLIDGEYIEMERLTEEPITTEDGEMIWTWTDEVFVDGNWQLREYFTENDYDTETLHREKVFGEDCHWDIAQDRWRTLFNNGMMADFSIYSSEYIE